MLGTGYLGAVHAACMAHIGHEVVGYDVDSAKIASLSAATSPFYEPGFDEFLAGALSTGRLHFTDSPEAAIAGATAHFVCVGTPQLNGSDAADVSFVDEAVSLVADYATCDGLIVGKSTVPVGTARRLIDRLAEHSTAYRLDVAWNPEFLREGTAVDDTLRPDRLVFGASSGSAIAVMEDIYRDLIDSGIPFLATNLATAEVVKVAANAFLATKISFINAMAEVCEIADADVVTLSRALGLDARIGKSFLNAGLGFGGGCLPKDIRAFSARAGELGASDALSFLREVDKINMRRREKTVALAAGMIGGNFLGTNIAVLGAAFKPNSDDVRDSPALNVAASMHLKGASVRVYDPKAMPNARRQFPTLTYCATLTDACRSADLLVLATEWQEFREMDPDTMKSIVRQPQMLDARNAVDPDIWKTAGWRIVGLGRGAVMASNEIKV